MTRLSRRFGTRSTNHPAAVMKILIAITVIILTGVFATATDVEASPQIDITDCLHYTTAQGLRSARIVDGLPLTPDQVREIRGRLSQFNSISGYPGLDDLGLPPEVVAEINRRIALQVAEWNKHAAGYPCMVFKSPTRTTGFARRVLLANGFQRAGLSIRKTSPRQFQVTGIQNGVQIYGIVVKTAKKQIAIFVESISPRRSQTKRFTTPFEA